MPDVAPSADWATEDPPPTHQPNPTPNKTAAHSATPDPREPGPAGGIAVNYRASTIAVSDNAAYNLMLQQIASPTSLQTILRGLGDSATRRQTSTAPNRQSTQQRPVTRATPAHHMPSPPTCAPKC